MKKTLVLIFVVFACISLTAAQEQLDERFEKAYQAWDGGDYVTALRGFEGILKGQDWERWLDRIALTTGELYQVTELAPDGAALRFSPSGRFAAYETGARGATVTHVVDLERKLAKAAEIQGTDLVFAPARDTAAYLKVRVNPEIAALREEIETLAAAPSQDRQALAAQQRELQAMETRNTDMVLRDLLSGNERRLEDDGLLKAGLAFSADGREVLFAGGRESGAATEIYAVGEGGKPRPLTSGPGFKVSPTAIPGGNYLVYALATQSPFPRAADPAAGTGARGGRGQGVPPGGARGGGRGGAQGGRREFVVWDLAARSGTAFTGSAPSVAADGSALAFLSEAGSETAIQYLKLGAPLAPAAIRKSQERIGSVALSPDGSLATFEMPYTRNTEIFCIKSDGTGEVRVSREIQPDWAPRFLSNRKILAVKGERRHARSFLYDLDTLTDTKLFHNNTVRTIAPEYEWAASPSGNAVLIQAERDGDTISPERGVYLVDLTRKVTRDDVLARIRAALSAELSLRAEGEAMFRPIADLIRTITEQTSITKIFEYEEALFRFDSKHISQPGNKPAGDYIFRTLASFGYHPEYQWFTPNNIRTANIIATLPGTENPELIYVLSSHYDSNQRGPGADDNSTGIAVLLETARILAKTRMPATIVFAAFTGEEAGLLGSREFVRQAQEKKLQIVGALNNDMIGWTNDHRLDNTIRYSNSGIRDLQHAAAFLFSKMITYDARYFKSTDAAAYFDAYGDIVGGFGSYPVLGNPYYHQATDLLETVNHQLLVEATKANTASIMRLAAGPSRLKDLKAGPPAGDAVEITWTPSPEKGVTSYSVAYGPDSDPTARTVTAKEPKVRISGLKKGAKTCVAVRAVTSRGLAGWDWARTTIQY